MSSALRQDPESITTFASLDEVCRACLGNTDKFESIHKIHNWTENANEKIKAVIEQLMQSKIDDESPERICLLCFKDLQLVYEFRRRCLRSKQCIEEFRSKTGNDQIGNDPLDPTTEIKVESDDLDDWHSLGADSPSSNTPEIEINDLPPIPTEVSPERRSSRRKRPVAISKPKLQPKPKRQKSDTPKNAKSTKVTEAVALEPVSHLCAQCGLSFDNKSDFIKHSKSHSKENRQFKFTCEFCQKGLLTKQLYLRHRNIHTHEQKFICDMCGKNLSNRTCLQLHFKYHLNIRKHKCEHCDLRFVTSRELKDHTRAKHVVKMIACTYENCTETFDSEHWLNIHLRLHQTNYQFRCDICGVACVNKYRLHEHKRIHTGESKSPCPYCSKVLSRPQHLRRHIETLHPSKAGTTAKT